jgi:D-arabinose 1-dehydrogenase-like Zn-dependent alcohol dehydrogenase
VELVLGGRVAIAPFIEKRPLSAINQTFEDIRDHKVPGRVVLVPEH